MAIFEPQKRPVYASQGVVAANHPLASAAGVQMLAHGGNAVDAALATIFACCVVEPPMVGPLGGGYIVSRSADGEITVIDHYAEGPARATEDMYEVDEARGPMETVGRTNRVGHLATGVPGNLKGWFRLHAERGSLPIRVIIAPAIDYAEHGFAVSPYLHAAIVGSQHDLARFPSSAEIFLKGGRPLGPGEWLRNPDQAETLRRIAERGPDYLYDGPLGEAIAKDMEEHGGLVTMEDIQAYEVRRPEPIRGTYRGFEVIGTPFTSAGGVLNQLGLNILESFDLHSLGFGTARYWHLVIETLKLMFADRARYMGDPRFVDVPQEQLLDKDYARKRAALIRTDRAQSFPAGDPAGAASGHTTHVTVMTADGATVTMTQTINDIFGAKAVVPGTGLLLNDNMALFDPHPGLPNSVGPRKRMLTATAATIIQKEGRPVAALGTPGGIRIFPSVFQAILNLIDHGMTMQEAVEAPRIWAAGNRVEVEPGVPHAVRRELEDMGHTLTEMATIAGCMNGVQMDEATGLLAAASCWRGDGAPSGLSGGRATVHEVW